MSDPQTLADLTYSVAVELKAVKEGTVTTSGISSFVDSYRTEAADYWNRGPAWVLKTSNGSAPQGEWGIVSDFASGGTVSLRASLTASIPVGATYALGRKRYPLDIITQNINKAYRDLGTIPVVDITTLETASDTTEYDIPAAARKDLREVWIQTKTAVAVDAGWVKVPKGFWRQERDHLYLPQQTSGYDIKLIYVGDAPFLSAYSDTLSPYVHPKRIIYKAAAACLLWRAERLGEQQAASILKRVNDLLDENQRAEYDHPIVIPKRTNKLFWLSWNRNDAEASFSDDESFMDVV